MYLAWNLISFRNYLNIESHSFIFGLYIWVVKMALAWIKVWWNNPPFPELSVSSGLWFWDRVSIPLWGARPGSAVGQYWYKSSRGWWVLLLHFYSDDAIGCSSLCCFGLVSRQRLSRSVSYKALHWMLLNYCKRKFTLFHWLFRPVWHWSAILFSSAALVLGEADTFTFTLTLTESRTRYGWLFTPDINIHLGWFNHKLAAKNTGVNRAYIRFIL